MREARARVGVGTALEGARPGVLWVRRARCWARRCAACSFNAKGAASVSGLGFVQW